MVTIDLYVDNYNQFLCRMSYNMPNKKLLPKIQFIVCQIVSVFIQQSQQAIQTDVLTGLFYKENNNSGFQKVVVRRNNGWSD